MEYTPRYPQPFTLTEALHFDISTITDGTWSHFVADSAHSSTGRDCEAGKLTCTPAHHPDDLEGRP